MMCTINDVHRRPLSTSINMNGKRRIGALSSMQGGLFAEASASSKSTSSTSSSSSYLSRLLQSRTSSGTLAGRINTTSTVAAGTSSTRPNCDSGNGSVISKWDRRPKPPASLLGLSLRDGRMAALEQRYGENRPAAAAAEQTRRIMQKRPRKPTDAYQYFFREQCREISKLESSRCAADGDDTPYGMTCSSNKRRKSPTGEAIHLSVDIGKIVAKKWRELSSDQRKKYEGMADEDAERYRKEVEEYYMQPDAAAAGMPRATTGRLAAIMAASSSSTRAPSNHLLLGNNGNGNSTTSTALTAVNNALSTTTSTSTSTSLATTNKTSLQSLLHERRTQLLDDLSSLNQITSSRLAAGRPALSGPVDPAVRQRLYHLSVGPGSSSSGNAAIGPSPWGKAVRSSNTAASSYLTAMTAADKTQPPANTSTPSLKTPSSPPVVSDGPTIEILN